MPKVSIIIPTYNRADLLPRAIASILAQTFRNFELIIVDDGSTDDTPEVVNKFQEKDNRVKYIRQENSGGAARPKNTGIKNAAGEYIAVLDSDDEWLPEKLAKQLNLFEKFNNPNLGFVGCHAFIVNKKPDGQNIFKIPSYRKSEFLEKILHRDYLGSGSGIMYKKSVFDDIGFFDENLKSGQDWEMRIRLLQKYDFEAVPEPLIKYHLHQASVSESLAFSQRAADIEYISNKHKNIFERYPAAQANILKYCGVNLMLAGDKKRAGLRFLRAIKIYPGLKIIFIFLLALAGKKIFHAVFNLKRKTTG